MRKGHGWTLAEWSLLLRRKGLGRIRVLARLHSRLSVALLWESAHAVVNSGARLDGLTRPRARSISVLRLRLLTNRKRTTYQSAHDDNEKRSRHLGLCYSKDSLLQC
jgi:hypothetical protein